MVAVCALVHVVPAAAQPPNLIQLENAKPGTTDWQLTNPGRASGVIEGYASLTSVNRGGRILLFVSTAEPLYTIDLFRLGYYGGLGGRRVRDTIQQVGVSQPVPTPDTATGLIECQWTNPFVLDIPNTSDPTDWMSGVYVAKLTASVSGTQAYIIFAVRDDARPSDLLMAQSVSTYQAYNPWGGKSLYGTLAQRTDDVNHAVQVSFNRPYFGDGTSGAGDYLYWEYWMAWWLEANGYDVSYATSIDLDANPTLLLSHRAYLSVGHDEYWSAAMRDHVEAARDAGVSLGFFSGNTSYWQVRFTPSPLTGDPSRTMVGYKNLWPQDPITPDSLKTNEWRLSPVNRPEDAMIGVRYITQARPPLIIDDASNWVFTGTGLHNGDVLTNPDGSAFLGYEVDAMGPASPPQTQRLAHSPADPTRANFADMTVYRAASGATVFAIGSIGWSFSLPATQQITRNVLARFISGAFSDTTPVRPPLPTPWSTADIGVVGRPGYVGAVTAQGFTLNGAGRDIYSANDALYYAYQPLSGDGTIIARLTALQLYWGNRAGVMIRESLDPGARYVAIHGRPTGSIGVLKEGVDLVTRPQAGAGPSFAGSIDVPMPYWLKLTRTGDLFEASVSSDGTTWTMVGRVTVPMQRAVYIGTHVLSAQPGVWMTASFDNITVTNVGSPPWQVVGVGDFNGDGHADVLWFNATTGTLAAWLLDGQGNLMAPQILSLTCGAGCSPWQVLGVGDFNGDGHADVLWFNTNTGTLAEWLLDGQGHVMAAAPNLSLTCGSGCSPQWRVVGVGDFNGDGHTDVLWFNASSGVLAAWLLDGQGHVTGALNLSLTCGAGCSLGQVVGVGDVNGDGHADVLWFNASSGVLGAWLLDGQGHVTGALNLSLTCGAGCSPPWQVLGVGDFNGDGHADVLWFNASSGVLAAWLLDAQGHVAGALNLSLTCGAGCSH